MSEEISIPSADLKVDRIVCVRCPAVAKIHMVYRHMLYLFVWAECHGEHVFGGFAEYHVRRTEHMDRSPLFEEIEPIDPDRLSAMSQDMERGASTTLDFVRAVEAFLALDSKRGAQITEENARST